MGQGLPQSQGHTQDPNTSLSAEPRGRAHRVRSPLIPERCLTFPRGRSQIQDEGFTHFLQMPWELGNQPASPSAGRAPSCGPGGDFTEGRGAACFQLNSQVTSDAASRPGQAGCGHLRVPWAAGTEAAMRAPCSAIPGFSEARAQTILSSGISPEARSTARTRRRVGA